MEGRSEGQPNHDSESYSLTEDDISNEELFRYAETKAFVGNDLHHFVTIRQKYAIEGDPPERTKGKIILSRKAFIKRFDIGDKVQEKIASHNHPPYDISDLEQREKPLSDKETDVAKAYDLAKKKGRKDILQLLKTGALTIVSREEDDNELDRLTFQHYVEKFGLDKDIKTD